MSTIRNAIFTCIAAAAVACAADSALLNYVMKDANVISGMNVDAAKSSRFGQYVLSQMQGNDADFQKFIADTQFDPRRDLTEIVAANAGTPDAQRFLIAGHGVFSPSIATTIVNAGATRTNYHGVDVLTHTQGTHDVAIAFPDGSTALMGTVDAVQAAIDQRTAPVSLPDAVIKKIGDLRSANDAWFVSTGPISNFFAGKIADPNLNGAMAGNLLQAVQQASGGIKFDSGGVRINGEALARSPKDAEALRDVVKFVAGLVQMNKDSSPEAQQVASLVDTLVVTAQDSTMQLSLSIPEDLVEKLFMPHTNTPAKANLHRRAALR